MGNKKYYIVRGERSGIFFGNIVEINGQEVLMSNVRRLWDWACSLSPLAQEGTIINCKFTAAVDKHLVLDAIEIDTCTNLMDLHKKITRMLQNF